MRILLSIITTISLLISACTLSSPPANDIELTAIPTATVVEQPTRTPITTANTNTAIPNTQAPLPANITTTNNGTVICNQQTSWTTYTIVAGDTLFDIAQRSNSTVDTLVSANCLVDAGVISVGQVLYVPNALQPRPSTNQTNTNNTTTDPRNDPNRYTVELWWIIRGDEGRTGFAVGCGDSIYLQQSGIPANLSMEQTIQRAFAYLTDDANAGVEFGDRGWWNPISTTGLYLVDYTIDGDHVTMNLAGALNLSGVCFDAQIEPQIALNVMSLTRTQSATIFVDGVNLRTYFDMSGQDTRTSYTMAEFQNQPSNSDALIEYWVGSETNASADAIPVGCDGYLIPIVTDDFIGEDVSQNIEVALTNLFDPNRNLPPVFLNFLNTQNLTVESVEVNNGDAVVNIGGNMLGIGVCSDSILEGQILQTIFQFDEVQTIKVMNGDRNLRQYVDMSGIGPLEGYIYTRPD